MHLIAFHPWQRFGDSQIGELFHQAFENTPADLGMGHFAPPEKDRGLYLVAIFEEALDVFLFELVIVLVDFWSELDLLDLDYLLMTPGLACSLLLLILILAEIHDAAHRRVRRRRDFDQIESLLPRDGERLRRRHDAELLAGVVDHTDLSNADSFVDPHAIVAAGISIESDKNLLY